MTTTHPEAALFSKCYTDVKDFAMPHLKYVRLESASKLASLLSFLILSLLAVNLATCLLIFLTFQFAYLLASLWGSLLLAILCIIGIYGLVALIIYYNRRCWIQQPIMRMLLRTFELRVEALSSNPIEEVDHQKEQLIFQIHKRHEQLDTKLNNLLSTPQRPTLADTISSLVKHCSTIWKGIRLGYKFMQHYRKG